MSTLDRTKIMNKAKMGLMDPNTATHGGSPVFYSSILFSLKLEWTDQIPTAAVDGKHLFVNKAWFCALKFLEQVGLLAHEVLHVGLRHIDYFHIYTRGVYTDNVEHDLYNQAGDHFINLALTAAGYILPPGGLYDTRFRNLSTIQIYHVLHDEYDPSQPGNNPGDIIFPAVDDSAQSQRDIAKLQKNITTILTKAKISSEMAREDPSDVMGGLIRDLHQKTHPRLPFEIILANYMSSYASDDFSYRRPNKRFMSEYYMPSLYSEHLCNLVCAFDISGSVTNAQLSSFRNGIRILKEELRPEKITLIEWDIDIRNIVEVTEATDIMNIQFHDGGGTRVQPLIDWIVENKPEVTLVFTDGDFRAPDFTGLTTDIVWLIEGDPKWKISHGKVFHYTL